MIPRLRPCLDKKELLNLFLPKSYDFLSQFEDKFSEILNSKHAIAYPYGRTALLFILKALGLKNEKIICPAYTCVVVAHAIIKSCNQPIFIDSQLYDYNMDLNLVENAIKRGARVLLATSLFGYPVNLDQLDNLKKNYPELIVIQDCAHSFGANWKGRLVQKEGICAFYGLNISKLITSIFGGMVTTDNDEIAGKLKIIQQNELIRPTWKKSILRRIYLFAVFFGFKNVFYNLVNYLENKNKLKRFVQYYDEAVIDFPNDYLVAMTNLEAKIGIIQLDKYTKILEHRRKLAQFYRDCLLAINTLELPPMVEGATYSHFVPKTFKKRELIEYARKAGVQLGGIIEYCIPEMEFYRTNYPQEWNFPNAHSFTNATINLPMNVNKKESQKVINIIKNFFNET